MKLKNFISSFFCAALILCAFDAAKAQTGYVTADILKVRASASTSSAVICRVSNGSPLEIISSEGNWCSVRLSDGSQGYVCADYISYDASHYATYGYVTATVLKVHSSTGVNSPVTGRLLCGARVELLAYDGYWYWIKTADNLYGYVSADYISLTPAVVSAPSVTYGFVTADVLKVHSSTGVNSPVIGRISGGERVELLAYDGSWYKIRTGGNLEGYVSADYISQTQGGQSSVGYVNATLLNIREAPGTETGIITQLVMGTELELISLDANWYTVRLANGTEGFANADYISKTPIEKDAVIAAEAGVIRSETRAAPTSETYSLGERIVAAAKNYIGIPYLYGAAGPDSFDCSGFVMYVMDKNGVQLPHQSGAQFAMGFEVAIDELIAGDLVFFNSSSTSAVSHVGIYIGENRFIHASSGSAHAVTVSSLNEDYYSAHYVGARRVI